MIPRCTEIVQLEEFSCLMTYDYLCNEDWVGTYKIILELKEEIGSGNHWYI